MKNIQTKTYIKGKIDFNYQPVLDDKDDDDHINERTNFKVIKGSSFKGQESIMEFTPDINGSFLLQLPPGTYSIVEEDRSNKFEFDKAKDQKWDKKCLKKEWGHPIITIKVEISDPLKVNFKYPKYNITNHPCLK